MKSSRTGLLALILVMVWGFQLQNASAQGSTGDFGIGLMLGEPSGVSVKSWLGSTTAFDVGAAWSLGEREALHMHADFLGHSWFKKNEQLAFYYGIGGRIIFDEDAHAGIRAPLGLTYVFESIPFDLFIEAVPILDVTPEVELAGNGAVGIRYYL